MATSCSRLSDAKLAALARHDFGLTRGDLQPAADAELENTQGVLVATRAGGELTVHEIPRWRSPAAVRAELAGRGWVTPAAWVGRRRLVPGH